MKTTWKEMIVSEMESNKECWKDTISSTFKAGEEDEYFDSGYGGINGGSFTLWTHLHVYFPACYDGAEWVGSVPRNPCEKKCDHFGGG